MTREAGKGDRSRVADQDRYAKNWDRIFGNDRRKRELEKLANESHRTPTYDKINAEDEVYFIEP
jgi:hypothetical protein